jgi:hypothetical protein
MPIAHVHEKIILGKIPSSSQESTLLHLLGDSSLLSR